MGERAIISMPQKQKMNTKISTESGMVGVDDASSLPLCTKLFLKAQGYKLEQNILFKDNKLLSYYRKMVKIV